MRRAPRPRLRRWPRAHRASLLHERRRARLLAGARTLEVGAMAGVLTVVAKVRAAKGKGDALAALVREQAAAVRAAEPGCLVYRAHRSPKDPDLFYFYEQYADEAALDTHRNAPHLAAFRERREREGLVDGPVSVELYHSITE